MFDFAVNTPNAITPTFLFRRDRRAKKLVWHPDCGPDLAEFTRDLAPRRAGVLTDVHLAEQAERHDAVGVGGMRGKAPHRGIGLGGERQGLPCLSEVCGAQHVPF